ncbi:MAG: M3 family metallopeptidase [Flavobacteriaceae bacterium]|nr:M3 family metallopeptidase [Flavobacteriaceae bacterium]
MSNRLLETFDAVPFSKFKVHELLPALKTAITEAQQEISHIAEQKDKPSFENTIVALDNSGYQLDRLSSLLFNLNSAETNDAIQEAAEQVAPLLSALSSDILQNEALFKRIEQVYQSDFNKLPEGENKMLLQRTYLRFVRNGALLSQKQKEQVKTIDEELSLLALKFGKNVLQETNDFHLHIPDKKDLKGLPERYINAAEEEAQNRKLEGYVFTLHYPSYVPFMTYVQNRSLRKKLYLAYNSRCNTKAETDNRPVIKKIIALRQQRAEILGFKDHADFVLQDRMAKNTKTVKTFLTEIKDKAKPKAVQEYTQLKQLAQERDQLTDLQAWDIAYYTEILKKEVLQLDTELLKPYFELHRVIDGLFNIVQTIFGLVIKPSSAIDVYHEEVKLYEVYDNNNRFLAHLYADFFPRKGKRSGAWMTWYKPQFKRKTDENSWINERPQVSIVCNFPKPTKNEPSLLSFNDVTTLFHEFGHALHGMLADTTYRSLSGTSVLWDFVELPSQLMENWCYTEEGLALFAQHYKTGEKLPKELIEKIKASAQFMQGSQHMRQLSFGFLDLSYHTKNAAGISDIEAHENELLANFRMTPIVPGCCMSTSFSHIFQGGYSAGYYSYKWAEVLDADAFEFFKEQGIMNPKAGEQFKNTVLQKGGTIAPENLYLLFRGKKPDPKALLKRSGLLKNY